jgi:pyruvate-ferredoxin/flavodoxin oxidoreductase
VTEELVAQGMKVGVLRIRMFRPFDTKMFCDAIPKSAKVVVCMDRAPEFVQAGGLIYRDVSVSLIKQRRINGVHVCGGRYSYLGSELMPKDIIAIYNTYYNQPIEKMPFEFVSGIIDDLNGKSLPDAPAEQVAEIEDKLLPPSVNQSLLYGIGSDGTIGAARNAVQILQNTASDIQV